MKQTKLDLDKECEAGRRLQQEVQESKEWKEQQGRRPFAFALIDADADGWSSWSLDASKHTREALSMPVSLGGFLA